MTGGPRRRRDRVHGLRLVHVSGGGQMMMVTGRRILGRHGPRDGRARVLSERLLLLLLVGRGDRTLLMMATVLFL